MSRPTRRRFLGAAATTALAGLADLSVFRPLAPARADDAKVTPEMIRFTPDIEPVVRLIEETPRDKCVAALVEQLRQGLPYRRFLAAIYLACMRRGNSHHDAWVVYSAHQLSLDARAEERLLPLFYAVDHFKRLQEKPAPPVAPIKGVLPSAEKAAAEFEDAMQRYDRERAERGLSALIQSEGPQQTADRFWRLMARDRTLLGHRAISAATCHGTLQVVGWQHAEPGLRHVIRHLFERGGQPDSSYAANVERVKKTIDKLPPAWTAHAGDGAATLELYALLRDAKAAQATELACTQLRSGKIAAGAIWDAIHLAAAELMVRHRHGHDVGGYALHCNTSASALHYGFRACGSADTRLLILLQALNWVAEFTNLEAQRNNLRDLKITELAGAAVPDKAETALEEIFGLLPGRTLPRAPIVDRAPQDEAARKTYAFTSDTANAQAFMRVARSYLFQKASSDAHDYKLPAALFEELDWIAPRIRPLILAASVHWLHGNKSPDLPALQQARAALKRS